jgi:squalene-hopene/tetraprenyl-beta-curcumene cyclase
MRRSTIVFLVALCAGIAARASAQKAPGLDQSRWNRAAAAKYLDDRMDAWFTNASKLRTGEGKTACVSCHTPLPYALARPALRRAMGVSAATSEETRLLDETVRRVASYGTHQLLNEADDAKKAESRGTEAVLNAVILASADAASHRREPSEATQKAVTGLWNTQRPDGAWDWLNFGLEPYETVEAVYQGATLAALAVGMVPGLATSPGAATEAGVGRLRAYLRDNFAAQSLYNRTCALLASSGFNDLLTRAQRDALVSELSRSQQDDGGWSLEKMGPWRWSGSEPPFKAPGTRDASLLGQSDGFATGLIVYTLMRAGLHADHPAVAAGVRWLRTHQQQIRVDERTWTAWRAYSLNVDREHGGPSGEPWRRLFMSDAASAFAVLALVEVDNERF